MPDREDECPELDDAHSKFSRTGLPFVTVKLAASLDGRIATKTGDSRWISSKPSLRMVHRLRREHDAVMVGIGTVLADDPQLTVRLVDGPSPLRVIVDGRLRIPESAQILSDTDAHRTLIATTEGADPGRMRELQKRGVEILLLPAGLQGRSADVHTGSGSSRVDLGALLSALGQRRIASVLVEGGAGIVTALTAERRVDRLVMVIAPKIIGSGIDAIGDLRIEHLRDAITFTRFKIRRLGPDVIFDARLTSSK
jgi:diaminohydroxyphosphoribosylaminopyrimidine deaminase/5-amino-6-(5-phosphoribosylamino)uracil reductase